MSDRDEEMPSIWDDLQALADRARAEGWTPEQTRAALFETVASQPELDETDKPAA